MGCIWVPWIYGSLDPWTGGQEASWAHLDILPDCRSPLSHLLRLHSSGATRTINLRCAYDHHAPCRCSFAYPFACSFVHMAVHLFIHLLTRSLVGPFIRLTARLPPCPPDFCSPTCPVIQPLLVHSSVRPHLRFEFYLAACPTSCLSIHAPTCPPALFPSCWPAHLGNSFEVAERLCP